MVSSRSVNANEKLGLLGRDALGDSQTVSVHTTIDEEGYQRDSASFDLVALKFETNVC